MRPVLLVLLVLLLAGCGGGTVDTADDPADDPADPARGGAMPTRVPAAPGEVRTRGIVTVLDDGDRPELCLGAVAESWPPQCGGPPLVGWDWRRQVEVPGQPGGGAGGAGEPRSFERAGGVRWGQYALTGRWDGTALTLTTAIPAALYDAVREEPEPEPPRPQDPPDGATLERIAGDLGRALPGAQSSSVQDGRVHVDVVYDDGSLQAWADGRYGPGVVMLTPALVDVADPSS